MTDILFSIGPNDTFGKQLVSYGPPCSIYNVIACSYGVVHKIDCSDIKEALHLYPEEYSKIKTHLSLAFDVTRRVS